MYLPTGTSKVLLENVESIVKIQKQEVTFL